MATVVTSIGSNSSIDTETPSSCSGSSSPYSVTFSTAPTGVSVGDKVEIVDEATYYATFTYRVTAIAGTSYTLAYVTDDGGAYVTESSGFNYDTSPCDLYDMSFGQAPATFKRFYSSIYNWNAGLSDSNVYATSDDAVGECHDDSIFSETTTLINPSITFNSITLTSHINSRHDGTKGSGVVIRQSGAGQTYPVQSITIKVNDVRISWLEFDGNDGIGSGSGASNGSVIRTTSTVSDATTMVDHCLFYDFIFDAGDSRPEAIIYNGSSHKITVQNNMIWAVDKANGYPAYIFYSGQATTGVLAYNNTIYNLTSSGGGGGYLFNANLSNDTTAKIRNLILMDWSAYTGITSNTPSLTLDYWGLEATDSDVDNVTVATVANTFKDSTTTDPNLHLKTSSDFIGAAVDLGTTPVDVEFDIDNYDRDTSGDAWDLGADQVPRTEVAPAAASFELAGVSPSVGQASLTITVAVAAFVLAGVTPTILYGSTTASPTAAAFKLPAITPTIIVGSTTASPIAASLELAGISPTIATGSIIASPAAAAFEMAGVSPAVTIIDPPITTAAAAFELAGITPTVVAGSVSITPSVAAFELAGISPSVAMGSVSIAPTVAAFELAGITPTVQTSSVSVTPAAAAFDLAAVDPSVVASSMALTPSVAVVELAGISPSASLSSVSITPTVAAVEFAGVSPAVQMSSSSVTPAVAAFELAGIVPTTILGSIGITPTASAVELAGINPSITAGSLSVSPAASVVELAGISPTTR